MAKKNKNAGPVRHITTDYHGYYVGAPTARAKFSPEDVRIYREDSTVNFYYAGHRSHPYTSTDETLVNLVWSLINGQDIEAILADRLDELNQPELAAILREINAANVKAREEEAKREKRNRAARERNAALRSLGLKKTPYGWE